MQEVSGTLAETINRREDFLPLPHLESDGILPLFPAVDWHALTLSGANNWAK